MKDRVDESLDLMRSALALLDEAEDPCNASPHLDLAIARIEQWRSQERKMEPSHPNLQ